MLQRPKPSLIPRKPPKIPSDDAESSSVRKEALAEVALGTPDFHDKQMTDRQRYKLAVETDYWFTICFRSGDQKTRFLAQTGWCHFYGRWEGNRFLRDIPPDSQTPRAFHLHETRLYQKPPVPPDAYLGDPFIPDPLSEVPYAGDVQNDPLIELDALLEAFQRYEQSPTMEYWEPVKSPHYIAVSFQCQAHKDTFLRHTHWMRLGDKYLDGVEMALIFEIALPKVVYPIAPPTLAPCYINGYWLAQLHGLEIPFTHLSNKETIKDKAWKRLSFMEYDV